MKKKIFTLIAAACMLGTGVANAQWTTNLAQNTSCNVQSGALQPLTAATKDGKTYISYYRVGFDGNYYMYMQLLDANGNKMWGNDGIVVTTYNSSTYGTTYDLTVDTAGNSIIGARYFDGTNDRLFVSKYNQIGNPLWGANGITLGTGGEGAAKLAITPANNVIVGDAYTGAIWKLTPAGANVWTTPIMLPNYDIRKVVPTNSEDFIAIYRKSGFGPYGKLKAMKFTATGTAKWTTTVAVSDQTVKGYQQDFHVSDGNNGFYSGFSNDSYLTYLQHVSDTGAFSWGVSGAQMSTDTFQFAIAGMAYNAAQNKVYAIAQMTDANQVMYGTKLQKFDSAGNVLLSATGKTLHSMGAGTPNYGLANINSGLAYSYIDTTNKLKVDKIDSVGNFIWQKIACTLGSNKTDVNINYASFITPSNVSLGINNYQTVLVWDDARDTTAVTGIYAQNFTDTASIPYPAAIVSVIKPNSVKLYPNPSNGNNVFLDINSNVTEALTISIIDATGRTLNTTTHNMVSGDNKIQLNVENIASGMYFIKCNSTSYQINFNWSCIK